VLEAMAELPLPPARIDWGLLAARFRRDATDPTPEAASRFVAEHLAECLDPPASVVDTPRDIVLYGFGRIGRLLARLFIERLGTGEIMRLRAVVTRPGQPDGLQKRASLLRRDSVHGRFEGTIQVDEENGAILANGNFIKMIESEAPDAVDYRAHDVERAIVIDNTGKWRDEEGLERHLACPGAEKVILTAPGKGAIKNVVYGVNHDDVEEGDTILSAASCTTNAITPVLKAIEEHFGIDSGHVETVHAFTNDQNLIDNYHKKSRRGRAAPLNMVITETGAAQAVAKALPQLKGKLTGSAIRVPTPNVSLAILSLNLAKPTTRDELNDYLRHVALHSPLQRVVDYSASPEISSTDLVGSRFAGIVDSKATIAKDSHAVVYVWYDNEMGYSAQVLRVVRRMAGVDVLTYPRWTVP
jgi:glyceraldehyde 3-phosphate dehydrogenase